MNPFDAVRRDPAVERLAVLLREARAGSIAVAEGLWGSAGYILTAEVWSRCSRPTLLVTAHGDDADAARDDLESATGTTPDLLPPLESFGGDTEADADLAAARLALCLKLTEHNRRQGSAPTDPPLLIVAPIQALMQPVPTAQAIESASLSVSVGQRLDEAATMEWIEQAGFTRCDQVEVPGDFARRGGIVDIFSPGLARPIRIELFGDEVESIRFFDAGTQRSADPINEVRIPAFTTAQVRIGIGKRGETNDKTTSLLALLPTDTLIVTNEPLEIQELGRTYWQRLGERAGIIPADAIFRRANDFAQLHLQRFAGGGLASDAPREIERTGGGAASPGRAVTFDVGSLPHFEAKRTQALRSLAELAAESDTLVLCDSQPEQQRFAELLASPADLLASENTDVVDIEALVTSLRRVKTGVGLLHRGFRWGKSAYVPHHELFQRYRQRRTLRKVAPARPIDSFFDLNAGDYVVHALHGIGRFVGLKTLERAESREEYLAIEFADNATIHVPVSQVHVVQKFIGAKHGKPKLSKIGGTAWKRTKERVAEAVTDMAAELLAIQAQRATQTGIAYPQDTNWQREFEGSFPYSETEDQLRALSEIKGDMTRPRPMDRLLCGDVGYGKTELAVRAAFKAVEFGKQVAVLVPTTVLAEQHFQTFRERMADYPFTVEALSRFRSPADQRRVISAAQRGHVDVLIGTHRLLSKDVHFADLGLVVIDEEQRFGVEHKERLKRMRATVDVLTLTATPIPRTLHMSMLGIRDISSLATAPVDRRAIVTQVRQWDQNLIREAVLRELNRDGQVYFVHNFVRDLESLANEIRRIVPEARVVFGHGQMSGPELEEVMTAFVRREADILVSTNIIETGLDIPSANTIFINRAERFGLADLHQLRGRVGRSKHRAYCYLMLSPKHPVQDNAARRLKAIEHYSDLGAGFQIAMRDLEIRGAGNILGPEQSGNIEAVGYEMYCQLLEQASRRLKNEPAEMWRPVNLDLGVAVAIPRGYVRSDKQRMEVYKRLASCRNVEEVGVLGNDLRDAYGAPPPEVDTLLLLATLRCHAAAWGVRSIVLKPPDVIFSIDDIALFEPLLEEGPGSPRVPDPKTVHWRLPKQLLDPERLLETLKTQFEKTAGKWQAK